ncbi:MAG: hypothetical protein HY825_15380 [Acidobacteria bacterium]|nr:hypothetical protein [Acidobacteriota bacterium]
MNDRIRFGRPAAGSLVVAAMSLAVACPVAAWQDELVKAFAGNDVVEDGLPAGG